MTAEIKPFRGAKDLIALADDWSSTAACHHVRMVAVPAQDDRISLKLEELHPGARERFFADLRAGKVDPWLADVFAKLSAILAGSDE
jgi:hypothetical protein